ncbi:hypothetical protein ABLN87_00455 [Ruegeria sp. SCPT10]|uniref:hypothetical protein n=1 Tax=Ruegeria sp. SCP10 TaxID=3141377 RepID=UPI00333DA95A
MTFRTVLNKIFFARGVVQTLPGDLAEDHEVTTPDQLKTSQSEIAGLFAEELRGRHPIHDAARIKLPEHHDTAN